MPPKFKRRTHGTPRQIGKAFPIMEKKKLPKLKYKLPRVLKFTFDAWIHPREGGDDYEVAIDVVAINRKIAEQKLRDYLDERSFQNDDYQLKKAVMLKSSERRELQKGGVKEKKEHPWTTRKESVQIAADHTKDIGGDTGVDADFKWKKPKKFGGDTGVDADYFKKGGKFRNVVVKYLDENLNKQFRVMEIAETIGFYQEAKQKGWEVISIEGMTEGGGKFKPKRHSYPHTGVFTYGAGKHIESLLQRYARRYIDKNTVVKLVGGTNVKGFSTADLDYTVSPPKASQQLWIAMHANRVTIPYLIDPWKIDLFPIHPHEKTTEVDWLKAQAKRLEDWQATHRKCLVRRIDKYERLGKLTPTQKKWRGRQAVSEMVGKL